MTEEKRERGRPRLVAKDAPQVAFKVEQATVEALDAWAVEQGISRNELMRREMERAVARWRRGKARRKT